MSSIERYLLERGIGRSSIYSSGAGEDSSDNDDVSDEDQIEINDGLDQSDTNEPQVFFLNTKIFSLHF